MPGDKLKTKPFSQSAPSVDTTSLHARFAPEVALPPRTRNKLDDLFGEIVKEFEMVYVEKYQLQEKVELLTERLEQCLNADPPGVVDKADPHDLLTPGDQTDKGQGATASLKKSGSQISQKIKTTYKTSTSRIVSTFKSPNVTSRVVCRYTGHKDGVWEVNVSKVGPKVIGTASADQTACLWNVEDGSPMVQYLGHKGSVNSIRFHPSESLALTSSGDHRAHVWKYQVPSDPIKPHSSSDDEVIGDTHVEHMDESFEAKSEASSIHTPLLELIGHHGVVIAADWLAHGQQVITASWDRKAILYDANTGQNIQTLIGHDQELTNVCGHSSQPLVLTSSNDTTFRLWDFRAPSYTLNVSQGHAQPVTCSVFVGSDKIVSGSDDRYVKIWDLKNLHSPIATIRTDSGVNRLSVSNSQNTIAVPHDNRHIRLYDITGIRIGRLPRNRRTHTRMVCCTAWNDEEGAVCNLFSSGFDSQTLGWNVSLLNKDGKGTTGKA